ncbi:MAG: hypothetical protein U1E23_10740 [Reyranellaceae bacterium]
MTPTLAWWRRHVGHPDPLVETTNTLAMLIALNQPFYPLTLWGLADGATPAALITLLSMPLFIAIPAVGRVSGLAGRAALPVVGTANTLLAVAVNGATTGVELFLLPCLAAAALSFRRGEWRVALGLIVAILAAWALASGLQGTPFVAWSPRDLPSLRNANAVSAIVLTAFIALLMARARGWLRLRDRR